MNDEIVHVVDAFQLPKGQLEPLGEGLIHDTFRYTCDESVFVLQRVNESVFPDARAVTENIRLTCEHLRRRCVAAGGSPRREVLSLRLSIDGCAAHRAGDSCWRCFPYIGPSTCLQQLTTTDQAREAGVAFGRFAGYMSDFPAQQLHVVLPGFHDLSIRLKQFEQAKAHADPACLRSGAKMIRLVESWADEYVAMNTQVLDGSIPLRVTHNDCKVNNLLYDEVGVTALCVIDLDTVMPGRLLYDYGDLMRSSNLETGQKEYHGLNQEYCQALSDGYLAGFDGMDDAERESLRFGPELITFILVIRLLTDHLNGDVYFKVQEPGENLERSKLQAELCTDLRAHRPFIQRCLSPRF